MLAAPEVPNLSVETYARERYATDSAIRDPGTASPKADPRDRDQPPACNPPEHQRTVAPGPGVGPQYSIVLLPNSLALPSRPRPHAAPSNAPTSRHT